jgi:hypothetical protein
MRWECDLWRRSPPANAPAGRDVPLENLFPSARRAIAQALIGTSRVGYPPYTSACVPRAIGFAATPVPFQATDTDGVLVHEPWGWPLELDRVFTEFADRQVILDRVDSADFFLRTFENPNITEVVSLSKTLGLLGGGLARRDGSLLRFQAKQRTGGLGRLGSRAGAIHAELFKNSDEMPHPIVTEWLAAYSVRDAMEQERQRRQVNLHLVAASPVAEAWPAWMHAAIDNGVGPGLAPILRQTDDAARASAMRTLAESFGVTSTISVFNWSADPLAAEYAPCLLLPIHGEMQRLPQVLHALYHHPTVVTL